MAGIGADLASIANVDGLIRVPLPTDVITRSPLTARETDVLRLMAEGLTTKDIAVKLNVRFKTAACHRSRVLQKLSANSTVTAVRWAIRQGIVAP